jgi:hypothetical protein
MHFASISAGLARRFGAQPAQVGVLIPRIEPDLQLLGISLAAA